MIMVPSEFMGKFIAERNAEDFDFAAYSLPEFLDLCRASYIEEEAKKRESTSSDGEEIDDAELAEEIEIEVPVYDSRCQTPQPHISEAKKVHEFVDDRHMFYKYVSIRFLHIRELVAMAEREPSDDILLRMVQAYDMAKDCYRGRRYEYSVTKPIEYDDYEDKSRPVSIMTISPSNEYNYDIEYDDYEQRSRPVSIMTISPSNEYNYDIEYDDYEQGSRPASMVSIMTISPTNNPQYDYASSIHDEIDDDLTDPIEHSD